MDEGARYRVHLEKARCRIPSRYGTERAHDPLVHGFDFTYPVDIQYARVRTIVVQNGGCLIQIDLKSILDNFS